MENSYQQNKIEGVFSDLSLWSLIASNLIAVVWALIAHWPLAIVLWIYWSQSVIIGILWFFKISTLKEFSTKGFRVNGRAVMPTQKTKKQTATFFLLHYGFFHFIYCIFLAGMFKGAKLIPILFMAIVFLMYQCFSFSYNKKWLQEKRPNIGTMMFFPYARIIPMHITIIVGGALINDKGGSASESSALLLFMLLKTLADAIMHIIERKGFGDKPA